MNKNSTFIVQSHYKHYISTKVAVKME